MGVFLSMCSNLNMYASLSVVHCTNYFGNMWNLYVVVCVVCSSSEILESDGKGTEAEELLSVRPRSSSLLKTTSHSFCHKLISKLNVSLALATILGGFKSFLLASEVGN